MEELTVLVCYEGLVLLPCFLGLVALARFCMIMDLVVSAGLTFCGVGRVISAGFA